MEFEVEVGDKITEERLTHVVCFFCRGLVGKVLAFDLRDFRVRGRLAFGYAQNAGCRVDSEKVFFEDGVEFDL